MASLDLAFHAFEFRQSSGAPLFVYSGTWENRSERAMRQSALSDSLAHEAFQSVLRRERNLGQQVAELAVSGCADGAAADAALRELLPRLFTRHPRPAE